MSTLSIKLDNNKLNYRPGEDIRGRASWSLSVPGNIEINLLWYTRGKGTVDATVTDSVKVEVAEREGEREFSFKLPEIPYSFSGKLISLIWAIEILLKPSNESVRLDFFLSPTGEEVLLGKYIEE